jgi:hypothetical protein
MIPDRDINPNGLSVQGRELGWGLVDPSHASMHSSTKSSKVLHRHGRRHVAAAWHAAAAATKARANLHFKKKVTATLTSQNFHRLSSQQKITWHFSVLRWSKYYSATLLLLLSTGLLSKF